MGPWPVDGFDVHECVMSLDIILFSIAPKAKPTPTLRHRSQHSIFEPHGHNYLVWVLSPADAVSLRFSGSVSTKWRPCLCLCAFREPFKSVEIPRMEPTSFLTLDFQWLRAGLVALKTPWKPISLTNQVMMLYFQTSQRSRPRFGAHTTSPEQITSPRA